jgi:FimV-like protein
MNKLLSLIVIVLFIAYVPLGPVNYSSELSGIFVFLGQLQANLSNIIDMSVTYIINIIGILFQNALPVLTSLFKMVLSLPYGEINYLYVLIILIIVSFFYEKFRSINNELNKLRKRISISRREDKSTSVDNSTEDMNTLNQKAVEILEMLTEISNAAKSIKDNHIRSKKIRRANSEILNTQDSVTKTSLAKDEDKLMRLRKDQTLQDNKVDIVSEVDNDNVIKPGLAKDEDKLMRLRKDQTLQDNKVDIVSEVDNDNVIKPGLAKDEDKLMRLRKDQVLQKSTPDEIMSDENISQIDLARAFIESNERDDAISLIKKIIETGTEEEKHEAKLLYMQIK